MRIIQLDIIRGIAISLVLAAHLGVGHDRNPGLESMLATIHSSPADWTHAPQQIVKAIVNAGWIGVDLFFVLSGFLVSGLLFKEFRKYKRIRLGRFLVRRGFKIYPSFYVFLGLTLVVFAVSGLRRVSSGQVLCEAAFLTNYGPNIWGHTWSLAVEEHFYILLGLVLIGLSHRNHSRPFHGFPSFVLLFALIELSLRLVTSYLRPEFEYKRHAFPTHLRLDSLFFGSLLAYYHVNFPQKLGFVHRSRPIIVAASIALIAPALVLSQDHLWMRTAGLTCLYLGFGGVLLSFLTMPLERHRWLGLPCATFAGIGFYSYSIYLWHVPVIAVGVPLLVRAMGGTGNPWIELSAYLIGAVGIGIGMARIVEFPFLKLRDRLLPSPMAQPEPRSMPFDDTSETNPASAACELDLQELPTEVQ